MSSPGPRAPRPNSIHRDERPPQRYDLPMTASPPDIAAHPIGAVRLQFVELPRPLALDCGRVLPHVRVAYETYGTLSPACDNVILVCHALSGDAHAAGYTETPSTARTRDGFRAEERDAERGRGLGWWDGMIGPGKAFDTDRFYIVSSNLLGGCAGTTGPSSPNPATGRPYGSDFPVITVADMVRAQRALLEELGITRLLAVAGGCRAQRTSATTSRPPSSRSRATSDTRPTRL